MPATSALDDHLRPAVPGCGLRLGAPPPQGISRVEHRGRAASGSNRAAFLLATMRTLDALLLHAGRLPARQAHRSRDRTATDTGRAPARRHQSKAQNRRTSSATARAKHGIAALSIRTTPK